MWGFYLVPLSEPVDRTRRHTEQQKHASHSDSIVTINVVWGRRGRWRWRERERERERKRRGRESTLHAVLCALKIRHDAYAHTHMIVTCACSFWNGQKLLAAYSQSFAKSCKHPPRGSGGEGRGARWESETMWSCPSLQIMLLRIERGGREGGKREKGRGEEREKRMACWVS